MFTRNTTTDTPSSSVSRNCMTNHNFEIEMLFNGRRKSLIIGNRQTRIYEIINDLFKRQRFFIERQNIRCFTVVNVNSIVNIDNIYDTVENIANKHNVRHICLIVNTHSSERQWGDS